MSNYITTFTGARFDYALPGPFRIEDVAHALSMIPRFAGHGRFFYSVAEHSLLVARILRDRGAQRVVQLAGLMHDAHEAYVGDAPRPLKVEVPDFKRFERSIQNACRLALAPGIPDEVYAGPVHDADECALHIEASRLFSPPPEWVDLVYDRFPVGILSQPLAEHLFLTEYARLR